MKHLDFKISGQSLQRLDGFKPATGSIEYLTAAFSFSSDWNGTTKTAKCRKGNSIYDATINSSGYCTIPFEVLAFDTSEAIFGKQYFHIWVEGIAGTKTITTDEVKIELSMQGAGSKKNASNPTPSVYAQFIEDVKAETKANADTATEQAANAGASAESAAASAASLKNDYSNALKGYARGAIISVNDVSPVEHFVNVIAHGKNIFNLSNHSEALTDNGEYLEAKAVHNRVEHIEYTVMPNTVYTLSFCAYDDSNPWIGVTIDGKSENNSGYKEFRKTFTTNATGKLSLKIGANSANDIGHKIRNVQLEIGKTATEYEPWLDPTTTTITDGKGNTYTPNADGTVEGITSTSPTMTLTSDNDNITIECEYNRDINKVISQLESLLNN